MGLGATLPNHIPACRSEFSAGPTTLKFIVPTINTAYVLVISENQVCDYLCEAV